MPLRIEKAKVIGFCSGVRRAIDIVEKAAREHGKLETLGAIVHNQPVLDKLSSIGVSIAGGVDEIKGNLVATSAHGLSPRIEQEIKARHIDIIDTTSCTGPRLQRADWPEPASSSSSTAT